MRFICLYLLEVICLLYFYPSNGTKHVPSKMCSSHEYEDCSFQLSSSIRNICHIHKPNKCLNNSINLSTLKLISEKEAKFSVSIQPYTAEIHDLHLSAINISITILEKGIKGFSLMTEIDGNTTLCRLIDFQSFSNELTTPLTLFYDCFYNLVEWNIQNVKMSFVSLPLNNKLSYFVHIPPVMTYDSKCMWQIAIMVFENSLSEGIVQVKILPTPEYANISLYSVKLIEETSNNVLKSHVTTSIANKDTHVVFASVKEGFYYVSVNPKMANVSNCLPAKTATFHVKIYNVDKILILYGCIILLLTLSCFSVLKCYKIYKYSELLPKQALLVHSFDCPEHESFISSFSAYLTNECKLSVSTIYGKKENTNKLTLDENVQVNTKDPKQWLRDKYKEADVIIFIISEGLYITLGKDKTVYVKEGTPWRQQLPSLKAYISLQLFNSNNRPLKKFCKIVFPYSNEKQIPQCLNDMGPYYKLPRDFNKFLCFVFNCNSWLSFINLYPKLSGSCPSSSIDGREMLKKMELVQIAVANKTNIIIIKKNKSIEKRCNENDTCSENDLSDCNFSFKSMNNIESIESEESETCDMDTEYVNCDNQNIFIKEWQNIFSSVLKNYKRPTENNPVEFLIQEEFNLR